MSLLFMILCKLYDICIAIKSIVEESSIKTSNMIQILEDQIQNDIAQSLVALNESFHAQWEESMLQSNWLQSNTTELLRNSTEFVLNALNSTVNDTASILVNDFNSSIQALNISLIDLLSVTNNESLVNALNYTDRVTELKFHRLANDMENMLENMTNHSIAMQEAFQQQLTDINVRLFNETSSLNNSLSSEIQQLHEIQNAYSNQSNLLHQEHALSVVNNTNYLKLLIQNLTYSMFNQSMLLNQSQWQMKNEMWLELENVSNVAFHNLTSNAELLRIDTRRGLETFSNQSRKELSIGLNALNDSFLVLTDKKWSEIDTQFKDMSSDYQTLINKLNISVLKTLQSSIDTHNTSSFMKIIGLIEPIQAQIIQNAKIFENNVTVLNQTNHQLYYDLKNKTHHSIQLVMNQTLDTELALLKKLNVTNMTMFEALDETKYQMQLFNDSMIDELSLLNNSMVEYMSNLQDTLQSDISSIHLLLTIMNYTIVDQIIPKVENQWQLQMIDIEKNTSNRIDILMLESNKTSNEFVTLSNNLISVENSTNYKLNDLNIALNSSIESVQAVMKNELKSVESQLSHIINMNKENSVGLIGNLTEILKDNTTMLVDMLKHAQSMLLNEFIHPLASNVTLLAGDLDDLQNKLHLIELLTEHNQNSTLSHIDMLSSDLRNVSISNANLSNAIDTQFPVLFDRIQTSTEYALDQLTRVNSTITDALRSWKLELNDVISNELNTTLQRHDEYLSTELPLNLQLLNVTTLLLEQNSTSMFNQLDKQADALSIMQQTVFNISRYVNRLGEEYQYEVGYFNSTMVNTVLPLQSTVDRLMETQVQHQMDLDKLINENVTLHKVTELFLDSNRQYHKEFNNKMNTLEMKLESNSLILNNVTVHVEGLMDQMKSVLSNNLVLQEEMNTKLTQDGIAMNEKHMNLVEKHVQQEDMLNKLSTSVFGGKSVGAVGGTSNSMESGLLAGTQQLQHELAKHISRVELSNSVTDKKLTALEEQVTQHTSQITALQSQHTQMDYQLKSIEKRLDKLEDNYEKLRKESATQESMDALRKLLYEMQGSIITHSNKVLDVIVSSNNNNIPTGGAK